jgi:uncharacterized protein (DUF983 family)
MHDHPSSSSTLNPPTRFSAMSAGFRHRCPHCAQGVLYRKYLKLVDECADCSTRLGHIRADDLPAYLTIMIVGHIIVPLLLWTEQTWQWSYWLHMAVWPAATTILTLLLLPSVKGAAVGLMWSLGLKGDEQR